MAGAPGVGPMNYTWQDALTLTVLAMLVAYAGAVGFAIWAVITRLMGA